MDFDSVTIKKTLPRLAWRASASEAGVSMEAGEGVAVTTGAAYEGAWAGALSKPDHMFGSMVERKGRSLLRCTPPTHTCDALYVVQRADGSFVTNSLVWALATAGIGKNTNPNPIRTALLTISHGVEAYQRLVAATDQAKVYRLAYMPFELGTDEIREDTFSPQRISELSYEDYRGQLLAVLGSVERNAAKSGFPTFVSTISSGYDSTACAALAKAMGHNFAITLDSGGGIDSGLPVGLEMGMDVRVLSRPGNDAVKVADNGTRYVEVEDLEGDCSEFVAGITNPGDLVMSPMEDDLRGAVVLTGFHGDKVWDFNCNSGPAIKRGDNSGSSLGEFRLRVGFVNVPVPYIGVVNNEAIKKLAQSKAMSPWRHGNPYNRPIPRRLGEDAGASRESFGVKKAAANVGVKLHPGATMCAIAKIAEERYL